MLIWRHQEVFRQYYRDEPALNTDDEIVDFPADNNNTLFKVRQQITGQTGNSEILK